jgi:Tfp pilus assembly PilM family ATPase
MMSSNKNTEEKVSIKKNDEKLKESRNLSFGKRKIDSAFGMSISDSSIELLEFRPFLTHKPSSYSRVSLENGIVKMGKIVDKNILADKIKTLLLNAKPGKVSSNRVVLSLPEEQTYTWSISMDKSISSSELKSRIFEEAKKLFH